MDNHHIVLWTVSLSVGQSYPKRRGRGSACCLKAAFHHDPDGKFHDFSQIFHFQVRPLPWPQNCILFSFVNVCFALHLSWKSTTAKKYVWNKLENPVCCVPWSYSSLCILRPPGLKFPNFACLQELPQTPWYSGDSKARGNSVNDTFTRQTGCCGVPATFVITTQSPKCTITQI